jgi:hypothetical protein
MIRSGDASIACHHRVSDANEYTVVFFHGNAECVADYEESLPRVFDIIECNSFLAEYRGYGQSTGQPGLGYLAADCQQFLRHLSTAEDKLIFFGRSIGCIQAIEAAAAAPNALGLVLESCISDVFEYLLLAASKVCDHPRYSDGYPLSTEQLNQSRQAIDSQFNVKAKLSSFNGSTLIVYSLNDIPIRQEWSEAAFRSIQGQKRIARVSNSNHNTIIKNNLKLYCESIQEMTTGRFQSDVTE